MRKILLTFSLLAFCFIGNTVMAQTAVSLKINHKLGSDNFAFETEASNNLDNPFKVNRMEYYMSGFTVFHDGASTAIDDLNVLVRANEDTTIDLGMLDATEITEIRFHIGIAEDLNHEDPASYAPSHPLAPQNPSMHWGWAAGYRFVAMEGNVGGNFSEVFQLHGLGDENYFETSPNPTATNTVNISLDIANEAATQLELFRADGSLVNTSILSNQGTATLQLGAKGLYFLRVSQEGKTVAYEKIIAQ